MSEQEQEIYATLVEINQEPTELYKILKFESLVSGGGEAKQVIAAGYVYLNGEVETQKRKKVYAGDLITFNDLHYQIVLKGQTDEYEVVRQDQFIEDAQQENKQGKKQENKQAKKSDPAKAKKTRKAISF